MTTNNIQPTGGYAAENDRVQQDVQSWAKQLLGDQGNPSKVQSDFAKFHSAYTADGGTATSAQQMDLELQSASGLDQSDKNTLAGMASEDLNIE